MVVAIGLVASGCAVAAPVADHAGPSTVPSTAVPLRSNPDVAAPLGSTDPFLHARGTGLSLDGEPYTPIGLNVYQLATLWGQNMGCGGMLADDQLDAFFAALPTRALVRMWAWQGSMATNPSTHERDWRPLDRVVAAAERRGIVLVVSLGSQHGNCDDGRWKDPAWYRGGYRHDDGGDGYSRTTVPYLDYVREIVARYRTSPAIGMWEPINEPEASTCLAGFRFAECYGHLSCPNPTDATAALRSFFDTVGREIRSIDPNHLIESGAIGGPQCGWAGSSFNEVNASAGIDVVGFHDYSSTPTVSAELSGRLAMSRALGKPLFVGERGMVAGSGGSCMSEATRVSSTSAATGSMFALGVAAIALWNYDAAPTGRCSLDIGPNDPLLGLVRGAVQSAS